MSYSVKFAKYSNPCNIVRLVPPPDESKTFIGKILTFDGVKSQIIPATCVPCPLSSSNEVLPSSKNLAPTI